MQQLQILFIGLSWMLPIHHADANEPSNKGEAVYNGTCIACHGADGAGSLPGVPDLKSLLAKPDAILLRSLLEGVQGQGIPIAMPPKGGNPALTEDDLKAVLTYMRQSFHSK